MTPLLLVAQALRARKAKAEATALEQLARRLEPKLRKRFLEAVARAKANVDVEALARAVLGGSLTQAQLAVKLGEWPELFGELAIDMRAGFLAGASHAYQAVDAAAVSLSFELVNPYAVTYANRKLPQIVASYQTGAREFIRSIIEEAVSGKHTVRDAATLIKDSIGLTPQYERAAQALRDRLIAEGITGERLEAKVARYQEKLLKARARTIARTEIVQAEVAGQRALWNEAALQGVFNRQTAKRVWRTNHEGTTKRGNPTPCQLCAPMDGQTISFSGVYEHPDIGNVNVFNEVLNGPPLHPNCLCEEHLVF